MNVSLSTDHFWLCPLPDFHGHYSVVLVKCVNWSERCFFRCYTREKINKINDSEINARKNVVLWGDNFSAEEKKMKFSRRSHF